MELTKAGTCGSKEVVEVRLGVYLRGDIARRLEEAQPTLVLVESRDIQKQDHS